MTAADLQALSAEAKAATQQAEGIAEQASLRGLTSARELVAARMYQQVIRLRIARDRAVDDLATANTNHEGALAEYRAVNWATV